MPPTQPNNDEWIAGQLKQLKIDVAALKARTSTLASVTTGLFVPARAYRAAAFTCSTFANVVPLDTLSFDPGENFNLTNHEFVAPVAGYYWVAGQGQLTTSPTEVQLYITKNGSAYTSGNDIGATASFGLEVTDIVECAAGDTLQLVIWVGSSTPVMNVSDLFNRLTVMRVA